MGKLTRLISSQSWMRVMAALCSGKGPRGVREIADISGLSVAGVHDVLRRLELAEVVERVAVRGRPSFKLSLSAADRLLLNNLLQQQREDSLRERASMFSARVPTALGWIDSTLATVRRAKASHFP